MTQPLRPAALGSTHRGSLTLPTYLPTCLLYLLAYLPTCLLAYSCAEVRVDVRAVPTSDAGLLARANAIAGDDAWCRA